MSDHSVQTAGATAGGILMHDPASRELREFREVGAVAVHVLTGLAAVAAFLLWRTARGALWPTVLAAVVVAASFDESDTDRAHHISTPAVGQRVTPGPVTTHSTPGRPAPGPSCRPGPSGPLPPAPARPGRRCDSPREAQRTPARPPAAAARSVPRARPCG